MYNMDSHIHSEYSPDSKSKLKDIFDMAKSRNIDILAISDHNTVDGSKEARRLTKNDDLLVIPSIEISSLEGHILKNNIDTLSSPLIFSRGVFWGKMIELRASICRLETKAIICLNPDFTWREPLKFYQNDEVVVDLK